MVQFFDLTRRKEDFVRYAPFHTGAIPSVFAASDGHDVSQREFDSCIFDGSFRATNTGKLELIVEGDLPSFLHNHAELDIDHSGEAPAIEVLPSSLFIPLFRPGHDIYGHWLIDILPHICVFLDKYRDCPVSVLMLDNTPPWAEQLLSVFFEEEISIQKIGFDRIYSGKLFLSSAVRDHDHLSNYSIALSSRAKPADESSDVEYPDLYIARRGASSGRVLRNVDAMERELARLGFKKIYPEDYPIPEQVKLFASARRIVGEAGSGLHNSIFSKRSAKLFVVQSAAQPHLIQAGLCRLKGQEVDYIWAHPDTNDWFAPFHVDLQVLFNRIQPGSYSQKAVRPANEAQMFIYESTGQNLGPIHYLEILKQISRFAEPSGYFEIGTETGASAAAFSCPTVCVDPQFKLSENAIGSKPSIHFFQCKSDRFFSNYSLSSLLPGGPDVCFLDGMHRYEFLLKDFLATERLCHNRSAILVHDCFPQNSRMALRQHVLGDDDEDMSTRYGWTGDVWKLIPILKAYRPDLLVHVIDAPPSGLLLIRSLDSTNNILEKSYTKIVEEFRALSIEEYGIDRLWGDYPFISSQALAENESEITTFFSFA